MPAAAHWLDSLGDPSARWWKRGPSGRPFQKHKILSWSLAAKIPATS